MLDIVCLVFVRGKKPDDAMLEMARERNLIVMATGTGCSRPVECFIQRGFMEVRSDG